MLFLKQCNQLWVRKDTVVSLCRLPFMVVLAKEDGAKQGSNSHNLGFFDTCGWYFLPPRGPKNLALTDLCAVQPAKDVNTCHVYGVGTGAQASAIFVFSVSWAPNDPEAKPKPSRRARSGSTGKARSAGPSADPLEARAADEPDAPALEVLTSVSPDPPVIVLEEMSGSDESSSPSVSAAAGDVIVLGSDSSPEPVPEAEVDAANLPAAPAAPEPTAQKRGRKRGGAAGGGKARAPPRKSSDASIAKMLHRLASWADEPLLDLDDALLRDARMDVDRYERLVRGDSGGQAADGPELPYHCVQLGCSQRFATPSELATHAAVCEATAQLLRQRNPDPYTVMGLGRTADSKAITRRFRDLSRRWHPDQTRVDTTHEFQVLNQAYRALTS